MLVGLFLFGSSVHAGTIVKAAGNDTLATAQNVDAAFGLQADPNIGDRSQNTSTLFPHATVKGAGDGTFDYYSFTVAQPGTRGLFDIDATSTTNSIAPFNSMLFLYSLDGGGSATFLGSNDDADAITDGAEGSTTLIDAYLEHTFPEAGEYIVGVSRDFSIPLFDGIGGTMVKDGDLYDLNISLVPVPEPSALVLSLTSIISLAVVGRRSLRRQESAAA